MAIRTHITGTLGATHLFMLDDSSRDGGSSGIATTFVAGAGGAFSANPVCSGVDNTFRSNTVNTFSADEPGGVIGNTADINVGSDLYRRWCVGLWVRSTDVGVPSCAYEQGGGTNNFAINVGLAKAITWQAADAGQQFIICQSNFLVSNGRAYMVLGQWQYHGEHAGSGNRGQLMINGVIQPQDGLDWFESSATDVFPSHTGNIAVGNTGDTLKSYNESTQRYVPRSKDVNMLILTKDRTYTEGECRELFERTVLADDVISGTVAQQQSALDALANTAYLGSNCAIQVRQASDATDYELTLDNITFGQDVNLKDIAVQYVGPNTLTIINSNGSNAVEVSTPPEYDLDGSTVLTGGGSIVLITPATLQLNGLIDGTEVRVFEAGTTTEVAGQETVNGGVFSVSLQTPSVDITVMSLGYQNIRLLAISLASDQSIPIQQQIDRQYANG